MEFTGQSPGSILASYASSPSRAHTRHVSQPSTGTVRRAGGSYDHPSGHFVGYGQLNQLTKFCSFRVTGNIDVRLLVSIEAVLELAPIHAETS